MKKGYTATAFYLICLVLCSCSATNGLTLSVTEPAPVYIPSDAQVVGIIDRSKPSDEGDNALDVLDRILTVEGRELDREGAQAALAGLTDALAANPRFLQIRRIEARGLGSPGVAVFPAVLPWTTIERLCAENGVDVVYALAFYDTDTKVDYQAVPIEVLGPLGIKVPAIEHRASMTTWIKTGWRIYDPINRVVQDEWRMDQHVVSAGAGINPVKAIEAITGRKEAVLDISSGMGGDYALRIVPYSIRVARDYYVRGTDNFQIARRRAQTGDWDGAAHLWEQELSNPKRKVAGRASYNMAIISEINGHLDAAVEWASKAYVDYRDRRGLRYLNILNNRIARNRELERQGH